MGKIVRVEVQSWGMFLGSFDLIWSCSLAWFFEVLSSALPGCERGLSRVFPGIARFGYAFRTGSTMGSAARVPCAALCSLASGQVSCRAVRVRRVGRDSGLLRQTWRFRAIKSRAGERDQKAERSLHGGRTAELV